MFTQLLQLTGLVQKWPTLTREEVRKHNTASSLWIVIDNSVYDITEILSHHPGGKGALLKRGGGVKDCAEDMMFHSRAARRDAQKYKIGELSSHDVAAPSPVPPATVPKQVSTSSSISKVVIPSDAEDAPEYGSEAALWDTADKNHPLSSSDTDVHLVFDERTDRSHMVH